MIERELCERMGISRTSVREVLRQLEAEELIRVEPRRGPVVAAITAEAAADIYEFRSILEPAAVRLFVQRRSPAELRELGRHLDAFRNAVAEGRLDAMVESMAEFHALIFRGSRNRELLAIGQRLQARISALRRSTLSLPGRALRALQEMQAILDAITAGDAEAAAAAVERHIASAREAALGGRAAA
ncbi:MAG: GntR family transcriptional regulator [Rhodovarius sp.]|nr:GntR family transcriptional regulator [Rhodovarius sp.]